MSDDQDILVLEDEDGKKVRFRILVNSLFAGDNQYIVLMPEDGDPDGDVEMIVLRVDNTEDGEGWLSTIEDDEEWAKVLEALEELNLDGYDLILEEDAEDEAKPAQGKEEQKK